MSQEQVEIRLSGRVYKMDTLRLTQIAASALAGLHNLIEEDCGTVLVDSHSDPTINNHIQNAKAAEDLWSFLFPPQEDELPF